MMRRFVLVMLTIIPLLLAARSEPPQVEKPETPSKRKFTVYGASLSITPSSDLSYLVFTGGVRCVTAEMELSADVLEIDVQTSEVTGGTELKVPESKVGQERVVEDPGAVVRSMAAEIKVPSARFEERAIRRVGAKGNVRVKGENINLTTGELVSTDGGNTWSASGRSTFNSCDDKGNCYKVSADYIVYDMSAEKAVARGNIDGQYSDKGGEPVLISAESVTLNLKEDEFSASTAEVTFDTRMMAHLTATDDASTKHEPAGQAGGGPQTATTGEPGQDRQDTRLKLRAAELVISQKSELRPDSRQVIEATGGIAVSGLLGDSGQEIMLTADKLTAYFTGGTSDQSGGTSAGSPNQTIRLEATGSPHLAQGSSTFDGERIVIRLTREKIVIEVDGEQTARLDVKELETQANDEDAGAQNEEGLPGNEEPPADSK